MAFVHVITVGLIPAIRAIIPPIPADIPALSSFKVAAVKFGSDIAVSVAVSGMFVSEDKGLRPTWTFPAGI